METITWDEFAKVELRVGKIISAKPFPEARKPAYILEADFGAEHIGVPGDRVCQRAGRSCVVRAR